MVADLGRTSMSSAPQLSRGVGHGVACAHLAARPGCGSPQGAGWGWATFRKCPLPRPLPPNRDFRFWKLYS